ncbi:MAG: leucyl aminopeptidase [Elusimicrobiota bacterium]
MIGITVTTLKEFHAGTEPLALFAYEDGIAAPGVSAATRKALFERAREEGFSGKAGETAAFPASDGTRERRFVLVGLGAKASADREALRKAGAALWKAARARHEVLGMLSPRPAGPELEGLLLSSYAFTKYKKPETPDKLAGVRVLVAAPSERRKAEAAVEKALLLAEAVHFTRDLVNEAPSDKTPESVAARAKALAGGGVSVKVLTKADCEKLGMGALLGVGRGAAQPPLLLHLVYKPSGKAKTRVALVGKGVLFDSGGLSLKPAQSMETMKCDMAGAATVLGLFKVLARLKVKAEVHGIAPLAYNLPDGDAVKPGDVLRAMNGKTIEVLNTDAEGRLILADALCYAGLLEPHALLDFATLTGAVVTALGGGVTGAMSNDRALLARFISAAKSCGEPVWELPLFEGYKENIKGRFADLQNIGKARGEAGSIIGGLFLQEFVPPKTPWAHFDFAGTAWTDGGNDLGPAGGTGALVRASAEWLLGLR